MHHDNKTNRNIDNIIKCGTRLKIVAKLLCAWQGTKLRFEITREQLKEKQDTTKHLKVGKVNKHKVFAARGK